MPTGDSVVFDRAAGFYDRTRALSPENRAAVTAVLRAELDGRGVCLDVGVGTGRIALPLAEAGVALVGVDLSSPMMAKLVDNAGGRAPFPLARADATALPFHDGSFAAGLVCHVLHLVRRWETAVLELVRAIRPGGVLLVDAGDTETGELHEVQSRFAAEAGVERVLPGLRAPADLDRLLSGTGAGVRLLPRLVDRRDVAPADLIQSYEDNLYAWTWGIDDAARRRAADATRAWAADRFGSLDRLRSVERHIVWRAYDLA